MSDEEMTAYLRRTLLDPDSAWPSIETLLHAWIPDASVAHSHADAVLMLSNNCDGDIHVRRALLRPRSRSFPTAVPAASGFSKEVAEAVAAKPGLRGVVLMKHGLVTWGGNSRESYDIHLEAHYEAQEYVAAARRPLPPAPSPRRGGGDAGVDSGSGSDGIGRTRPHQRTGATRPQSAALYVILKRLAGRWKAATAADERQLLQEHQPRRDLGEG